MSIPLVCSGCGRPSSVDIAVTGQVPLCACGKPLLPREPLVFVCACGVRSKPWLIGLDQARPCPKCRQPLAAEAPTAANMPTIMHATSAVVPQVSSAELLFEEWDGWLPTAVAATADALAEQIAMPGASSPGVDAQGSLVGMFGRYGIIRELGRGGMGVVYLVHDPTVKREVALKVLLGGEDAGGTAIARFVREARAAGQLRHPHIVAVHDAGELAGRHYFTMDFIQGKELAQVLEEGRTELRTLLQWMSQVCDALAHAHLKGIIHRDLKPQNILIDETGRPLVMDFGLAKDFSSISFQSLSGTVIGTPAYMSPEQARGGSDVLDQRSDVYALGVILYEIATHQRPFVGDTLFETIRSVINDEPVAPLQCKPTLDPGLDAIILQCLEKEPARRYQSASDLAADLQRLLTGQPVVARHPSLVSQWWRAGRALSRRQPLLMGGVVAVAVAALLLTVWLARPSAVEQLIAETRLADASRARAAAVTLGAQLADHTIRAHVERRRAIGALRGLVETEDGETASAALSALVAAQADQLESLLMARALDPATPAQLRFRCLDLLPKYLAGNVPTASALAKHALAVDQPEVAAKFIVAATAVEATTAIEIVSAALLDGKRPAAWRVAMMNGVAAKMPIAHAVGDQLFMSLSVDPEEMVSDAAVAIIGRMRTRSVVIERYGLDKSAGKADRRAADDGSKQLAESESDAAAKALVAPVLAKLHDADAGVRVQAAWDLGMLESSLAIKDLQAALDDSNASVRRAAATALIRLAVVAPSESAPLVARLDLPDAVLRKEAIRLLGGLEYREAGAAIASHLQATERDERLVALMALTRLGDRAQLPALRTAWAAQIDDVEMCIALIGAFTANRALDSAALPDLITALTHSSRRVREAAQGGLEAATGQELGSSASAWSKWLELKP